MTKSAEQSELTFEDSSGCDVPQLQEINQRLDIKNIRESFVFPKYFEIETVNACNARCVMLSLIHI